MKKNSSLGRKPLFAMLPPVNDDMRSWAERLVKDVPGLDVAVLENDAAVRAVLADVDAAYGWVSPSMLPLAQNLRWLQNPFAGPFPGYYYRELVDHLVVVTNPRGIYSDHIAHHILMLMLALSRGLAYYMDAQRAGRWDPRARKHGYVNVAGSTVLINGVGGIGAETARLCAALGATVVGVDPRPEHDCPAAIHAPSALDELLPTADFVVTTAPHTPETEFMWNADRFGRMKPTAYFINIGRGMTAKLDDLTTALAGGEIAGAGLDVFEIEPLPADHPLWRMENVLITPHVAVAEAADIPERRYALLAENARRFLAGEPLRNVVDKALWY
ncbi:MAG: D-2-hydroxyacid dehydrogenase [Gammaproteobacteria bacterium]|nr:D-2-hydroxyacid dehydrogenase [Gammaproteobacteria bacterium]